MSDREADASNEVSEPCVSAQSVEEGHSIEEHQNGGASVVRSFEPREGHVLFAKAGVDRGEVVGGERTVAGLRYELVEELPRLVAVTRRGEGIGQKRGEDGATREMSIGRELGHGFREHFEAVTLPEEGPPPP